MSCHRGDVRSMLAENYTRCTTADATNGRNMARKKADNKVAGGANVSDMMLLVCAR
jgi:hypothetical protein